MNARADLLARVIEHVAAHGLGDTSLRQLASATGSSHRMLNYHFGGRDGLVAAIVESVEDQQRVALRSIADHASSPGELVSTQWSQLSAPELRPFIALFFEVLVLSVRGAPGTEGFLGELTEPWIELGLQIAGELGADLSPADIRLGIAVVRGLLLDVVATADATAATASLDRFLEIWPPTRNSPAGDGSALPH